MTSVLHRHGLSQRLMRLLAVLSVVAMLGCQPSAKTTEKKKNDPGLSNPTSSASPIDTPVDEPPAAGKAKDSSLEVPIKDLPGVDTPVQKMPDPQGTKEPASKEPPAPKKTGNEAPQPDKKPAPTSAAVSEPDSDVAAMWMPVGQVSDTKAASAAVSEPSLDVAVKWLPKPADNPAAEAKNQAGMKPYSETLTANVKLDMAPIPGGTFKMGSPAGEKDRKADEGPQVNVKIEPFWMGKYETTWSQYELWQMGLDKQRRNTKQTTPTSWDKLADALAIPTKPYSDMTFGMGKEGYPAICMTQFAAKMYCKWLSAKTGHYYRLPTEAEWEYACRAGTTTAYSFGNDPEKLGDYAWSTDNSNEKYHKVGKKKPNPWGLYDMHGNVAEWCVDQYSADRYKKLGDKLLENPVDIVTKAYPQVARGGAWTDEAPLLRSAARRASSKEWKAQDPQIPKSIWYHTDAQFVGFRVLRPLRVPSPEEAARYEITEYEKQEFLDYRKAQAGKQ